MWLNANCTRGFDCNPIAPHFTHIHAWCTTQGVWSNIIARKSLLGGAFLYIHARLWQQESTINVWFQVFCVHWRSTFHTIVSYVLFLSVAYIDLMSATFPELFRHLVCTFHDRAFFSSYSYHICTPLSLPLSLSPFLSVSVTLIDAQTFTLFHKSYSLNHCGRKIA